MSAIRLLELVLEDLAAGVAREHVDDLELLGDLLHHEPGGAAVSTIASRSSERAAPSRSTTTAHAALAALGVGQADHRDVGDLGVREEQVLDLLGRDVLALADDDVLEPPATVRLPCSSTRAEVAGAEVAVVVERLGVERGSR